MQGDAGAANTRLEVGSNGDARIRIDLDDGRERTQGTIVVLAGRWMLTQGFTPPPGAEIDAMDTAALNSQLVMTLLQATVPTGPPSPGAPQRVSFAERSRPITLSTATASAEYGAPWSVEGTVTVPSADAAANYQLAFTFSARTGTIATHLSGTVANQKATMVLPDSMRLTGWTVYKIGPYRRQLSDGTRIDYGARRANPKARTLGELRKLK